MASQKLDNVQSIMLRLSFHVRMLMAISEFDNKNYFF